MQYVVVATPCWPAPVSAMMSFSIRSPANRVHRIVNFVGPGVGEVLPPDGGPAPFTPAFCPLKRSRSADKIPKQSGIGRFEFRVLPGLFEEIPPQHFRYELPAELSIVTVLNDGMLRHDVQCVLN